MTSTYINEIRKKQKEYLGCLFNKFEKYSNEKFLHNLITKSINEISLYPFQDVNDNEVIEDINDFINELTINAQYKKKSVFKHLCENFLSDNFYIYNENDRYELKYVILKLLFLISESSKNENIKQVDLLFDKYFCIKDKHNEEKEKKNLQDEYIYKLNMNEKLALDEIKNYNIQEQEKYLKEFYLDDNNYVNYDYHHEKRHDNLHNYDENKYSDDIYTQCSSASEQYEMSDKTSKENTSDEDMKLNNQESFEKNSYSDFYQTQNSYVENYMKNKSELAYENVIKKIYECVYTYPHYQDNTNNIIKKKNATSTRNDDISTMPQSDKSDTYNKNNSNEGKKKSMHTNHLKNGISISSDDDIFISMKRRQKKKSKYEENMYKLKPKEQYFFNDINIYDEETYENNNFLENENNIIYETDIYNLRNVFFTNTKSNHYEEGEEHEYDTNSNEYKTKEKKELSNQMYDKNVYLNDINQVDNKLNHNNKNSNSNNSNNNNNNNNFIIDEVAKCKNQEINTINNKFCDYNKDMNIKNNRRTHKSNSFYVSESFIIKEILMILSLNCPIKFKNNFYMNCSDFLFNKKMDKQKIKDDFLFYINIEKRKECYQKINGKPFRKKKKLFFEKSNDKNNISICYHAVIKKMMNTKLYNIKKKIFNNYIKKMKKITIKLFYINLFICIIENFRNFLYFLPYNLYDIFNYIIHVKESVDQENGKESNTFLSFLFNNMISVNINNNKGDNNNDSEMYNIYINRSCNNFNNYCEGNFLNCFLSSLKNIYSEWITIINILYNYHILIILRQYDIVSVTKEQIVDLVKQIEHIKILKHLKLRHFINFTRKKNRRDRKYKDNIRNKINNKENNNIYINDNINMTNKTNISNNSYNNHNNNNNYYYNHIDQELIEEISSFRSLSLIHLNYLIINYLFMWDNLYDFVNVILSYSLYDSNVYLYPNNHKKEVNNKKLYTTHYDNAKKFCVCYDMFILYWRNSQILNNKYLEKVYRYFLDELNIYYSKYINDWIKKGQIFDKFNEFFICPEKKEKTVYPYNDTTLNIKMQNEFVLCPEFFHSFIFYIISLGNNIRLHMKINNEKNNIDYVDYYVREELNQYRKIFKNNSDMYYNTYNNLYCASNDDNSNELFFFGEYTNNIKILHVNTLNSYYNLENLKYDPNSSLDILCKFLKKSKNKCLPYFNKNVISLNISYDIYIKKYLQEQFSEIYYRSNRIFLYSLMKYCYLLEYFSCLRSLVFLEINDYMLPFFEFIFKENCFLIIDERNMNSIFRQCVYNNTNITAQNKNKFINTNDGNYTCSSFLHQKFTLIHMKIIFSKILDMENHKKYKRKRIFLHMKNDNKIVQNGDEYNNTTIFEERNYKKLNNGKYTMLLKQNDDDTEYIDNNNNIEDDDFMYENYNTCTYNNLLDNSKHNTIQQHDPHYNIKCSSDIRTDENLRKYSICEKLTNTFYKEEIISNIFKKFYLKLKENTLYNNNVNVISYRNLIIESKGAPFVNFLFDSKCLEKYSAIFSYFLEIKKSFHILNLVYIFYKYVKSEKPLHFDNYYMILSSLCVLKYKIYFFINTLYTYFQWILTYSWNRFLINLSESKSLTDIKKNHEFYINFLIEAILIPIKTSHEELYNYYINDEYNKDNDIYKEYEQKFFNSSIRKNDEDSNISLSIHHINNISSNNKDTNLLINNNSTNIIIDKTKTDMYVHQNQKHNNISKNIIYKEKNAVLNKNSMDKQFLLNELFANNILNIIFIPSQIYEILLKLSKFLNIKFDLNFDNAYYNTYENYYKDQFKTSEDYEDEYNENSENDINDEYNENSDNDIIKIKRNLLNTSQNNNNNNNNNNNLKKLENEQFIFSIKNDIKALTKIFQINYSEFMKKLNIISFNAEDNSFFGPNKNYKLFNHIIRLDKNILKKISILEYMLSFQSYNNPTDVIN
ncbi:hypothetical protein PFNF135_05752 [Plasmodium falciparum NF135/5.C10]|uniref:Gamma tubulin complex component protein N-terminal domain-containing protein n=1 Tax=Plasmodium falciparum NF135/5.C10 TaxID=1036726 RepID=W4I7Q8_PLAFA|nr:hypothetical protein PFNF135_05752 [Plasmodium falciparum NF135/5.C10]